jgi:DNA topoisomerase I
VSLNVGYDNLIPHCPVKGHAWKAISSNNESTWLAKFKDELNTYSDSSKYLFLAADSKLKGDNDKKKYERARRLKNIINKVREGYVTSMKSKNRDEN